MVYIIIGIFIIFLALEILFLNRFSRRYFDKEEKLSIEIKRLKEENIRLEGQINDLESKETIQFLFYELTRKIAPYLNKEELFCVFSEEIKHLGGIERVSFGEPCEGEYCLSYPLGEYNNKQEQILVKAVSKKVIEYLPFFVKLLKLCLERLKLYETIQQLSIYDALTGIYNRRYFMYRFLEEFNRALKFNLNLSFLMIDIDGFKNVNDTYGHLAGDVILRKAAHIIGENIREIDCLARFGGEEFSIILLDTDKAGAIMVGERICRQLSEERISVFDEVLSVTASIGIGAFPQNTLHSDVLIEISDKALYKAKIFGKNRVCWF